MQQINRAAPASGVLKHPGSIPPSRLKSCVKDYAAASPGTSCPARRAFTSGFQKNGAPGSDLSMISGVLQTASCRTPGVPLSATGAKKYFSRNLATSQSRNLKKSSPRTSRGAKEERQRQARKQVSIYNRKRLKKGHVF